MPNQWQSGNDRNWKTRGARFKPPSRLSTKPFGVFRGFLRNSRKQELGSLRKTPTEGTSPVGPGSRSGQLALKTTTKHLFSTDCFMYYFYCTPLTLITTEIAAAALTVTDMKEPSTVNICCRTRLACVEKNLEVERCGTQFQVFPSQQRVQIRQRRCSVCA